MEAKKRPGETPEAGARFGFTVTKKLGGAVQRNRIRRRLKAAAATTAQNANPAYDFVLIARKPAESLAFKLLCQDMEKALKRTVTPRENNQI